MFYLDINTPRFQKAVNEHYKHSRYVVKKRLHGDRFTEKAPIFQKSGINKIAIDKTLFRYLDNEDNLRRILIGLPEELSSIKSKFCRQKKDLLKILNYDYFNKKGVYQQNRNFVDRYNSFHLTSNLGYNTCVYCNRNYINTITNGIRVHKLKNRKMPTKFLIARPTLDHWFPKSKYPILAISFFNLIPTCSVCNSSLKGSVDLNLNEHFHPYHINNDENKQLKYRFNFDLENTEKARLIIESSNTFSRKSIESYNLDKLYSGHNTELRDLLKLKKHFGTSYLSNLQKILKETDITSTEMQRIIFGNLSDSEHALKTPLSKFRTDILNRLGVI